jgi:hypothetical protein
MKWFRIAAACIVVALLVPLAWANGGRPPPFPPPGPAAKPIAEDMGKTLSSKKTQYVTTFDPKATRTKIVIPQKFINAAAKAPAKDGAARTSSLGSGNTLIAGMALSLCLVSGGVWWSKRGSSLGKGKTALLAIGVFGASMLVASALFADIATFPPKDKGKGVGPGINPFGMAKTDVDIEITEKGDTVYLVIPGAGFGGLGGGNGGNGGNFGGGFGGGGGILPNNKPLPPKDGPPKNGGQDE